MQLIRALRVAGLVSLAAVLIAILILFARTVQRRRLRQPGRPARASDADLLAALLAQPPGAGRSWP